MNRLPSGERLQKVLAAAGLGSRRTIEQWISQGRVSVNGDVAQLGKRVTAGDKLIVDGKTVINPLGKTVTTKVLMYHKPAGVICAKSDPGGRQTVFDVLPKLNPRRWHLVGRLDFNTTGLLLLTNNGLLAHRLMHPSYEIEREYAVRVLGELQTQHLKQLRQGIMLTDGIASFRQISVRGGACSNRWYHVSLAEGRNREVRRMFEYLGFTVSRLTRVRFGPIKLPEFLPRGAVRVMSSDQVNLLKRSVKL